ncbi:hypothetical protein STEG23_016149, partial [Scotinomys teguina]
CFRSSPESPVTQRQGICDLPLNHTSRHTPCFLPSGKTGQSHRQCQWLENGPVNKMLAVQAGECVFESPAAMKKSLTMVVCVYNPSAGEAE